MKEDKLSETLNFVKGLTGSTLEVGWDGEIGGYMSVNEFGFMGADKKGVKRNIPPRPVLRNTGDDKVVQNRILKSLAVDIFSEKKPFFTLAKIGGLLKNSIIKNIFSFSSPANAPSTIKKKGFDKPLIGGYKGVRSGAASKSLKIWVNGEEESFDG